MYCKKCGKEINDDSKYCCYCGEKVDNEKTFTHDTGPIHYYNMKENNFVKTRSRITAFVLGLILGPLGVHNFYLGYKKKGAIQLTLTILANILFIVVSIGFFIFLFNTSLSGLSDAGSFVEFFNSLEAKEFFLYISSLGIGIAIQSGVAIWSFVESIIIVSNKTCKDADGNFLN